MKRKGAPHLLEVFGIELEYMIVDAKTLDVLPISDEVLKAGAGRYTNEVHDGAIGWSNEFVLHLIELKNNEPRNSLAGLSKEFRESIARVNSILKRYGACLMPSGMHPWMDPRRETRMWPRRYKHIYATYDRIFNCRRHGWANVQSVHLNVSFSGDDEFARLHTACRLLLPILPALAASSPFLKGKLTGRKDTRLVHYMMNQAKYPSIMGSLVPEMVSTVKDYRQEILQRMYSEIEQEDPEGTLQYEWLNSRGVIPRFERNALEIRALDVQECPAADIAIASIVLGVLKDLTEEKWCGFEEQATWHEKDLLRIMRKVIRNGEDALINNERYAKMFGYREGKVRAADLWKHLRGSFERSITDRRAEKAIDLILAQGSLSTRLHRALGDHPSRDTLRAVYRELTRCLAKDVQFEP